MTCALTQFHAMPNSKIRRPGEGRSPERLLAFIGRFAGPDPMIADVIRAAATAAGVSIQDLVSPRRQMFLNFPRQCAMWVAYHATRRTLPEIGRRFGDRDHTTVMHAIRVTDKRLAEGLEAARMITAILEALAARPRLAVHIDPEARLVPTPVSARWPAQQTRAPRPLPANAAKPRREMPPELCAITGEAGSRLWFEQNDARFRAGLAAAARRAGV